MTRFKRLRELVRTISTMESRVLVSTGQAAVPVGEARSRFPISSGCGGLDALLQGGYFAGDLALIYGANGAGKSMMIFHAIAAVERRQGLAVLIDMDRAPQPDFARRMGIALQNVLVCRPEGILEAFGFIEQLIGEKEVDLIALDSSTALFLEVQAGVCSHKLWSNFWKKIALDLKHRRDKVMLVSADDAPHEALGDCCGLHISLRRGADLTAGLARGFHSRIMVNKVDQNRRKGVVELDVVDDRGFSGVGNLNDLKSCV